MTTGPRTPERDSPERQALEALAASTRTADATTFALRYGLARRPGRGIVAGVCAALVEAYGLPVRLMRACMVVLALLGPGLFVYLALFLLLPRVPVRVDGDGEGEKFDIPARSLARGHVQPGDLVVVIALVPSLIVAGAMGWMYTTRVQVGLAFLLPIALILGLVLGVGAWRASRARTTYLFAVLAKQAGIVGEKELWRTVDELRREAPRAWGRVGVHSAETDASHQRPAPRVSTWHAWTRLIIMILAALAVYSLGSFYPKLLPGLDPDGPLAALTRAGVALGVVALGAGASLVRWGAAGKRSPQVVAVGLICALCFGSSVAWTRLTDSRGVSPIVLRVDEYQPGALIECHPGGYRQWNRPVIIDFSGLGAPPTSAQAHRAWVERNPGSDPSLVDLSMTISCDRGVGDVEVILPPESWAVDTSLTTAFGSYDAEHWQGFQRWDPTTVSIKLMGELGAGDVTYAPAGSPPQKGNRSS